MSPRMKSSERSLLVLGIGASTICLTSLLLSPQQCCFERQRFGLVTFCPRATHCISINNSRERTHDFAFVIFIEDDLIPVEFAVYVQTDSLLIVEFCATYLI